MRCETCGQEILEGRSCPHCGARASNVRILSQEEERAYSGLTIDEATGEADEPEESLRQQRRSGYAGWQDGLRGSRIYMRRSDRLNLLEQFLRGGWMMKIAFGAGLIAIVFFLVFVMLPVALTGLGVIFFAYLIWRFLH